jgi:outer membrane protein assembly factor BamB
MRSAVTMTFLGTLLAGTAFAQMGMGGGATSGMMGGSGMLQVADDGSVLVTRMEMSMMGGGSQGLDRSVTDVAPDGQVRWTADFSTGWPMMLATNGDLAVVVLTPEWWYGGDGDDGGQGARQLTLVGLDLASGAERWRTDLDGDMASPPQFAPNGSQLYVSTREMGGTGGPGGGPMHQGDAWGSGALMSTTVISLDRSGQVQWTLDLDGGHMGGPPAPHLEAP